jgi:hypothetical protein
MKGSCNCGKVSFEISDDIFGLYQCHCKLCQKQSGSTSNTATIVKASGFTWLSGLDCITHWKKDSGFTSHFCRQCGCPVPNELRETHYYWIPMGLVENFDVKVTAHLYCYSKASWDTLPDEGVRHKEMPPVLDDFIKSFQINNE